MPRVGLSFMALHRFLVSVLATAFTISAAHAQNPADGYIEIPGGDSDIETPEDWIRARREAIEVAREDQIAAPPAEVDALFANLEAEIADPVLDLQVRVMLQRALLQGMQGSYTDDHPSVIRNAQRLERLEARLEEDAAVTSEPE